MIYGIIILAIAVVYLFIKVRKLEKHKSLVTAEMLSKKPNEKPPLEVVENLNGGVVLIYKGKIIYEAKPRQ